MVSVINTINKFNALNIPIRVQYLMNESLIQRARNEMVRVFLESECTHLIFVDADIEFHYDSIYKLLQADKDIIGGICPTKSINWDLVRKACENNEEHLNYFTGKMVINFEMGETKAEITEEGLIKLRSIGTGFMMIKRQVFERLSDVVESYRISSLKNPNTGEFIDPLVKNFFTVKVDDTEDAGVLLSEDYGFCQLWRSIGGEIYADPFLEFGHVGSYIYRGNIMSLSKYADQD